MIEEHKPTHITDFGGLFSRGPAEVVPPNHFTEMTNYRFITGGIATRYGTSLSLSIPAGVRRWFPYSIEGQMNRMLYLDASGMIFDSLFPSQAILNIPTMVDFSLVVFNDRAYISPHNRITGQAGEKLYVYQGSGLFARPAGGVAPTSIAIAAAQSPLVGSVEKGNHLYAVAFLTDTGYVTKPGAYVSHVAVGNFQTRLTDVPIGPPGTIARYILATKIIATTTLDVMSEELFFIEGGKIENNVGTEIDVSFFDADLVKSADYLIDQFDEIPAFLGMSTYTGSLVGWAPNTEPSMVYVSLSGEPESISLIEGGIQVDSTSGGGVKSCVEYRGQLMIHKSGRVYQTSSNDMEPVYWQKPIMIDHGIGTEVFGVAAILDEEGGSTDRYILGSRKGIIAYDGTFNNNLTSKIDDIWKRINRLAFNTIQLAFDSINECIYAAISLDNSTTPNAILFGDCQKGIDPINIRWALWTFPYNPTCIGIDVDIAGRPVFKIGSLAGDISYINSELYSDKGQSIPHPTFRTAWIGNEEIAVNQFSGIRVSASGSGTFVIEIVGHGDAPLINPQALAVTMNPRKLLERAFDIQSQYISLKFRTQGFGDNVQVTRVSVYETPMYFSEPG